MEGGCNHLCLAPFRSTHKNLSHKRMIAPLLIVNPTVSFVKLNNSLELCMKPLSIDEPLYMLCAFLVIQLVECTTPAQMANWIIGLLVLRSCNGRLH